MDLKEYFDSFTLSDIHDLVSYKETESLTLEFKISDYQADMRNFAKCLSGFANSQGGILIWGVKASKNEVGIDAAKELKPLASIRKLESHLKRIEGTCVSPLIKGVEYKRIEEIEDKGYLLVYIPESMQSPHMALTDKHYYKRSGDSFYACEHFDLIDMFNRRRKPQGTVELQSEQIKLRFSDKDQPGYESIICIRNTGQTSLKNIVLEVNVHSPYLISIYGLDGNMTRGMEQYRTITSSGMKYIGRNNLVIHPNTYHEVDKIVLNEFGGNNPLCELLIDYRLFAEDMEMQQGVIRKDVTLFEIVGNK